MVHEWVFNAEDCSWSQTGRTEARVPFASGSVFCDFEQDGKLKRVRIDADTLTRGSTIQPGTSGWMEDEIPSK